MARSDGTSPESGEYAPLAPAAAERRVLEFEDSVRRIARRFAPDEFGIRVADCFRAMRREPQLMRFSPPHMLVHAYEATCAYYQPYYYQELTERLFAKTVNLWHAFDDPYIRFVFQPSDEFFALGHFMHRTQIELQGGLWHVQIARALHLFGDRGCVPAITRAFEDRFGITPREWIKMSLVLNSVALKDDIGFDHGYMRLVDQVGLGRERFERFLSEITWTTQQIGARYRALRQNTAGKWATPPVLWSQMRPSLRDHPLVKHPKGYLLPVPALIVRNLADGLRDRIGALEGATVEAEIASQFERYIERVLRTIPKCGAIHTKRTLEGSIASCDLVVELEETILLVECKATWLDRDFVTANAVLRDSPFRRTADGCEQLVLTAERIRSGDLQTQIKPGGRPILGFVVLMGQLPLANDPRAWRETLGRIASRGIDQGRVDAALDEPPQILDVTGIELLAILLQLKPQSVRSVLQQKLSQPYLLVGEWDDYLHGLVRKEPQAPLSFWRDRVTDLNDEMNVPRE